ncbi:MAG TPA: hydroxyisourate hydrolase [Trebonia sp.]|nr:hydroxyisourate hydrolase [Trebonia sp.]
MVTVSTHVLDAAAGQPAAGVRVTLEARGPANLWGPAGDGTTDDDGRFRFPAGLARGEYRLTFGSGEYFAAQGVATFYPSVIVTFMTAAGHYHVPLLLSPFAYSTYRGS